jgi:hypothetical protein
MTASSPYAGAHGHAYANVQKAAMVAGVVFLLVGILGFIPGITTNYNLMSFAGHDSGAMLLGVFQVSVLHNIVHLAYGVVGLALARSAAGSRNYLVWGGVLYLLFWLYGLIIGHGTAANFVPFNVADNWLHFVLGVAMVVLGLVLTRTHRETMHT